MEKILTYEFRSIGYNIHQHFSKSFGDFIHDPIDAEILFETFS